MKQIVCPVVWEHSKADMEFRMKQAAPYVQRENIQLGSAWRLSQTVLYAFPELIKLARE